MYTAKEVFHKLNYLEREKPFKKTGVGWVSRTNTRLFRD